MPHAGAQKKSLIKPPSHQLCLFYLISTIDEFFPQQDRTHSDNKRHEYRQPNRIRRTEIVQSSKHWSSVLMFLTPHQPAFVSRHHQWDKFNRLKQKPVHSVAENNTAPLTAILPLRTDRQHERLTAILSRRDRYLALKEPIDKLEQTRRKISKQLALYTEDPNGKLLLLKQMTSIDASLTALIMKSQNISFLNNRLLRMCRRVRALKPLACVLYPRSPTDMKSYKEKRERELGTSRCGFRREEARFADENEMSFGGLSRPQTDRVDFESGPLSPYTRRFVKTFDLMGLHSKGIIDKITYVCIQHLFSRHLVEQFSGQLGKKKRRKLQKKFHHFIYSHLAYARSYFYDVIERGVALPFVHLNVSQQKLYGLIITHHSFVFTAKHLLDSFWSCNQFFDQIPKHLRKADIVLLDLRCLNDHPILREPVRKFIELNIPREDIDHIFWVN